MSRFVSRSVRICALAVTLPLLGGCANYIFNKFDIDGSSDSLSIDAKQRMILSTREGGKTRDRKIVCAEPSPDALSAMSASGSASGAISFPTLLGPAASPQQGTTSGQGALAGASSEAVASLAMRTQTIQLLRDGYYRLCEAYMNGAIDQHQYNIVLLNIDRVMVTLMGVDGIAGTKNVASVSISPGVPKTSAVSRLPPRPKPEEGAEKLAEWEKMAANAADVDKSGGFSDTRTETVHPAGAVQSEAIANIVLASNTTAIPALCISLLASGELRLDNPGQHSVLKACDYLLQGAVRRPPSQTRHTYAVSRNAAQAQHPLPKQ